MKRNYHDTQAKWPMFFSFLVILLFGFVPLPGMAAKHPRALQIERQLTESVQASLRQLLGAKPFMIHIHVEPMTAEKYQSEKTRLPFVGPIEEEVIDLWNDPDVPDYMLLNRVDRITANIIVPQEIPDQLVEEIKLVARKQWPFQEGRDFIQIEKKNMKWPSKEEEDKESLFTTVQKGIWGILAALLLYAFLHVLGVFMASKRLASAIGQIKIDVSALPMSGAGLMNSSRENHQNSEPNASSLKGDTRITGGELQLHDTIKISELILNWVSELERVKNFPTLEDMKILEEELVAHPSSVGALVNAFPEELKNAVFAYSKSDKWFEALLKPSLLDAKSFSLMNRLMRVNRSLRPEMEEKFLLHAWYAEDKLSEFLKSLEADDVVWILAQLPKSLSLALGREVLPGRWAILLDHQKIAKMRRKPSADQLETYLNKLAQLKPQRTPELLSLFKQERDLISYLNQVHPQVEKEIYLAAGERSGILILRPPFFPLFELDERLLKEFCQHIPLELLARSLFNLSKDYRMQIEKVLSDKQKFVLLDHLRRMDKKGVTQEKVAEARTEVGRQLMEFLKQASLVNNHPETGVEPQAA